MQVTDFQASETPKRAEKSKQKISWLSSVEAQ
jgi:hypothetical protein